MKCGTAGMQGPQHRNKQKVNDIDSPDAPQRQRPNR